MMALTVPQRELLDFIRAEMKANGFPPTLREMVAFRGVGSKGSVQGMLTALQAKGWIKRLPRRARAIELVNTKDDHASDCRCLACAQKRYFAQLKLIQGLKVLPPISICKAIGAGRGTNIRQLDPITRANLLGAEPRKAAPRTRTAVPSGGAG